MREDPLASATLKRVEPSSFLKLLADEFRRYLVFRPDLLPLRVRSEWKALPEARPIPSDEVQRIIEDELAIPCNLKFAFIEPHPLDARFCTQSHRAWLPTGEAVIVKVRRPEIDPLFSSNSAYISELEGAFEPLISDRNELQSAVQHFLQRLTARAELGEEMIGLTILRDEAREFPVLCAPILHRALCTARVLVVGQLLGSDPVSPGSAGGHVADSICFVWLRQVLLGQTFLCEPDLLDFTIVPHRQIGVHGGVFGTMTARTKLHLQGYLAAVVSEDPDRALDYLLAEMSCIHPGADTRELRRRFRYAIPFRDGTWAEPGDDDLLDHVLVHWELANSHGYRPSPSLLQFYEGALRVTTEAQRLAARRAVFQRAWEGTRSQIILTGIKRMTAGRYWSNNFEKYAALISAIADSASRLVGSGVLAPEHLMQLVDAGSSKRRNWLVNGVVLLLMLISFALLASKLIRTAPWGDALSAAIFAILGIALLRTLARG